ncbi:endonuclease/exonuclease/phosphatase family protein [Poseidonocella sedimentorum]|uniref:Endonuclease/Exonuclease/phosphatase family protein n=1 Tax=Poseidonocella sedimentorum TaxID=871652 RepID=A0A1I6D2U5_9RHOB|nr:endonuclease/exonuclease/phosphatase family protein [Poseidonocella sedimentorum]SFQ99617.1 Endonuclease/Exonuclease/phosphatase family protein [Poseidonocella sedimentorum]
MPPFPRPPEFPYDTATEIAALRRWRDTKPGRSIPPRGAGNLLLASWNIANLGDPGQPRDARDLALMAEMISWFDLVAIQEVKRDAGPLQALRAMLPESYRAVFTDWAGNNERLAYLYDSAVVERLELAGEIAVAPASQRYVRLPGIEAKFRGFDRNPFAVGFAREGLRLTVVNAHLYFGSDSTRHKNRRALENYAVARWADLNRKSADAYTRNVIVIGDLNMPKAEPDDPIYAALTKRGLFLPIHQTRIGTTIAGDAHYDQIAFFPGQSATRFRTSGVFDFDGAVFAELWQAEGERPFDAFVRYHLSDHRLLWAQFDCAEEAG